MHQGPKIKHQRYTGVQVQINSKPSDWAQIRPKLRIRKDVAIPCADITQNHADRLATHKNTEQSGVQAESADK